MRRIPPGAAIESCHNYGLAVFMLFFIQGCVCLLLTDCTDNSCGINVMVAFASTDPVQISRAKVIIWS